MAGALVVESVEIEPGGKFRSSGRAQQPQLAAAVAAVLPDGGSPSTMVVPKIATTTVSRGDSLWRLSRRYFGGWTTGECRGGQHDDLMSQVVDLNKPAPGDAKTHS